MDLKQTLMQQGMKLVSNPRVMKMLQDERVMKAMMSAMSLPAKVSTITETTGEKVAKLFAMATAREIRDLRRTVRKLEQQLEDMRRREGRD